MYTIDVQSLDGEHVAMVCLNDKGEVIFSSVNAKHRIVVSSLGKVVETHGHEDNEIVVGSKVISFDFESRDLEGEQACYVEGEVVKMGSFPEFPDCDRYKIRVDKRVFGGKEVAPEDDHVYSPLNGTPTTLGRSTNGVYLIRTDTK